MTHELRNARRFRIFNKRFDFPCLSDLANVNGTHHICDFNSTGHYSASDVPVDSTSLSAQEILRINEKQIYDYTMELLFNYSSTTLFQKYRKELNSQNYSQRTIALFNYGLHFQDASSWIVRPMANAIYDYSKKFRKKNDQAWGADEDIVVYRETSSQSFSFSRGDIFSCVLYHKFY